jgi:type II secretory pathway predicted ATPase ExeA
MARKKTTVYLDEEVLRATKIMAARTGRPEYEIVDEAMALAYEELHTMRRV